MIDGLDWTGLDCHFTRPQVGAWVNRSFATQLERQSVENDGIEDNTQRQIKMTFES
jgi:hypothetical protein